MKKFLILFFIVFSSTFSVHAQGPSVPTDSSNIDGLFGKYFARMVNSCDTNQFQIVTGFDKTPNIFGEIICTDIRKVLEKISGLISIGTTTKLPGANVTIQWPVMVTDANVADNASLNTLVTKKYVDESFSQVDVGVISGIPGQVVKVRFNKKFKTEPFVIAVIENFQYEQKQEQYCWEVKKKRSRLWWHYIDRQCEMRTPMVKLDLGARVLRISKNEAQLQISPKVQNGQVATVKWLAISTNSPITSILSNIVNPVQPEIPAFSEEEKERLKKESQEEADEAAADIEYIQKELEGIKKEMKEFKEAMVNNKKEIDLLRKEIDAIKKSSGTSGVIMDSSWREELCIRVWGYWYTSGSYCDYEYYAGRGWL